MDGWKQCKNELNRDATHTKVSMDNVLTTATIDAHGGRNVGICNIPGAFLSADMDTDLTMALHGRLAALMLTIVPQIYRHHVIYKKGSLFLYVTLKKALYGCLR